jgi:phage tail sheath gpL-like
MNAPSFNFIPGGGLVAPLFAFEVNSGGAYYPVNRFVILGHATSAGTIAANHPVPVASQIDADGLGGAGSMLREMYRIAVQNGPTLPIWLVAIPETGTKAQWTFTLTQWSGTGVAAIEIGGERIQVSVGPADTPTTIAASLAAAINAYYNALTGTQLQVAASASAGVVTLTALHKGVIFNDLDLFIPTAYLGNVLAQTGICTIAQSVAGAGIPDLTSALAALGDDPADVIVSPWSDSNSANAYANCTNDTSGRWSWARQSYGHVWADATGNFSTLTTLGLTLNDRHFTLIGRIPGTPTPAYLNVCARAALEAPWLFDCDTGNVSRNQTGRVVQGVKPPRDRATWWNYSARNTLNQSGISTFKVNAAGNVVIDKTVTTYRLGLQGQPDAVFRDAQALYQCSGGLSYIRTVLADEQGQKALANTNPGSLAAITTTKDITATFVHAYKQLCLNGVFDDADKFVGLLVVQRDSQNAARVNVYCPMERVDPLDIIAANATIYTQYPATA